MHSTQTSVLRDGLHLAVTIDVPDEVDLDKPQNVVMGMHGFTGSQDGTVIRACSARLVREGFVFIRFDFNGHGRSEGRFEDMTVLNEVADANAVFSRVRDGSLGLSAKRVFLLGHSQGGVVTSLLGGLYPDVISGCVLLAPAATLADDAVCGSTQGISYDPRRIPASLEFNGRHLGGFYLRTAQVLPIYQIASRFHGPVCLIHGKADNVVDTHASLRYRFAYEHAELHLLGGADHVFTGREDEAAGIAADFLRHQCQN